MSIWVPCQLNGVWKGDTIVVDGVVQVTHDGFEPVRFPIDKKGAYISMRFSVAGVDITYHLTGPVLARAGGSVMVVCNDIKVKPDRIVQAPRDFDRSDGDHGYEKAEWHRGC